MIKSIEQARLKKANRWSQLLQNDKVNHSILVQQQKKDLAIDILNSAKKNNSNLIVLTSHSGPIAQTILGGIARDILLQAQCPVLIFYRPKAIHNQTSILQPSKS